MRQPQEQRVRIGICPPNTQVAELLATAHREGHAWADMAILCRHHSEMDMCAATWA